VILALVAVAIAILIGLAVSSMRDPSIVASDQIVRLTQSRLASRSSLDIAVYVIENHTNVLDSSGIDPERLLYEVKQVGSSMLSATVQDATTGLSPTRSTLAVRVTATAQEARTAANPVPNAPEALVQSIAAIQSVPWPDVVARADIDLSEFALLAASPLPAVVYASPGSGGTGSPQPKLTIAKNAEISVWRNAPLASLGDPLVIGSTRRDPNDVTVDPRARLTGVQRITAGAFPASQEQAEAQLADGTRTLPEDIHVPRLAMPHAFQADDEYQPVDPTSGSLGLIGGSPHIRLRHPAGGRFTSVSLAFNAGLGPGQWRVVQIRSLDVTLSDCAWRFDDPTMLVVAGRLRLDRSRLEVGEHGALTIVAPDGLLLEQSYIGPALAAGSVGWDWLGNHPYGTGGASRVLVLEGGNPHGFRLIDTAKNPGDGPGNWVRRPDTPGGSSPTITKNGTQITDNSVLVGEIYAPDSSLAIHSPGALYGRALAREITIGIGGRFFYDPQLGTGAGWLNPQSGIWVGAATARPEVRSIALLNDESLGAFSNSTGLAVGPVGCGMLMTASLHDRGFVKNPAASLGLGQASATSAALSPLRPTGVPGGFVAASDSPSNPPRYPDRFVLRGTLRDLRLAIELGGHQDFPFGTTTAAPLVGLVASELDADGKPARAPASQRSARTLATQFRDASNRPIPPILFDPSRGDIAGAYGATRASEIRSDATFAGWFRDQVGANLPMPFGIWFARCESSDSTPANPRWWYQFHANDFGPSHQQLFGDALILLPPNQPLNRGFTLELEGNFVYRSGKPQWLHVRSADDLWIFINGKLVVDLGGRRGVAEQFVELSRVAKVFGLSDLENCTIKIFFANRQTTLAPLQIWTNFALEETAPPAGDSPRFRSLNAVKAARDAVTANLRADFYPPLVDPTAPSRPRILGFSTATAAGATPNRE
jgi:fibro-slime domain-containing protein